ncbi:hypothetical protein IBX65_08735 [Candidatus Aerophobetes bacterium]|nr:hypothetical protein [Candidatus Aerophobetes bacterium]
MTLLISGREVKAVYMKDTNAVYVELLLKRGDCPEKKEFPDIQFCPGDCQGTYFSVIAGDDKLRVIGGIYPRSHIMYNEEFVKRHNLKKEEIAEYVKGYLKNNPCTVQPYMDGRKKRIYVKGKHIQTLFEGCVFRIAQGEFVEFLSKLRAKELEEIAQNLEKIKKIAVSQRI